MTEDKYINKLRNLLSFNLNLSEYCDVGPLIKQSPDYILEKYNHWIGFDPITDFPQYTPDDHTLFFHQYHKTWWRFRSCENVKRQLLYLRETSSLNMMVMFKSFEKYIGPIDMIDDSIKPGLHAKIFEFSDEVLKGNKENIKVILREMKLRDLF